MIAGGRFDVVVADTIRVVGLADGSDPPLIVDFDDLFSTRYADLEAAGGNPESLLGYYGRSLPRTLVKPLAMIAGRALRREAKVLRRREVALARSSAAVSLVGEQEAAELARRAGVPVAWLPMAVPVVDPIAPVARNPGDRFACLGGMDFQANLLSLRWFADEVLPAVLELCPDFHLQMIGYCPDRVRDELTRPGLSFAGYVDDLEDELRQYRGFVAPITTGTGVKTKVLDAMAVGLPVVSTPLGVAGLSARDGPNACWPRIQPASRRRSRGSRNGPGSRGPGFGRPRAGPQIVHARGDRGALAGCPRRHLSERLPPI